MIELLIWIVTLLAHLEPDIDDSNCYEDAAVVIVLQSWDENGTNQHLVGPMSGALMCVPVDDMYNAVTP